MKAAFGWVLFASCIGLQAVSPNFEDGKTPLRTVHVAVSGDDGGGDGSVASPFRTIGRALSGVTPGTAVAVHPGDYLQRAYVEGVAGTEANPIWIGGVPGQAKPRFMGSSEGLHFSRVRYLVVHDLEVTQQSDNGINADDGGDYANEAATAHVVFRNLHIHHIGSGGNQDCLKLSGVRDYHVHSSVFEYGSAGGSGIDHVGCHRGIIEENVFLQMGSNAVQSKGGSSDIEIRRNRVVNHSGGERAFNIGGSTGFEYFRPPLSTTVANYEARDIRLIANWIEGYETPFAFVGSRDCVASNNTVILPGRWLMRILQETLTSGSYVFGACASNRVLNNLFYYARDTMASTLINVGSNTQAGSFEYSHNLWFNRSDPGHSTPSGMPVAETQGLFGQDPMFLDFAARDLRLSEGSPGVGSGRSEAFLTLDFSGTPWASPPSRGAWELVVENRAPLLQTIGNAQVTSGEALVIRVQATDADGDDLLYSASGEVP
jgi:hypothetical protein